LGTILQKYESAITPLQSSSSGEKISFKITIQNNLNITDNLYTVYILIII
jgi:hypothetical protein